MIMPKGGKRKGAGRPKGAVNRRTREFRQAVEKSGQAPLEYMLHVMRTSKDQKRRDWAAAAAAPYVHPRLQSAMVKQEEPLVIINQDVDLISLARDVALLFYLADRELQLEQKTNTVLEKFQ